MIYKNTLYHFMREYLDDHLEMLKGDWEYTE